jgi:hypothetical protein
MQVVLKRHARWRIIGVAKLDELDRAFGRGTLCGCHKKWHGLAIIGHAVLYGLAKFTEGEALTIQTVANSPSLSWLYITSRVARTRSASEN